MKCSYTDGIKMSNLRKVCQNFRSIPGMNQRFTWKEKEIFDLERGIILGLLEDLHSCADGVRHERKVEPYLGRGYMYRDS